MSTPLRPMLQWESRVSGVPTSSYTGHGVQVDQRRPYGNIESSDCMVVNPASFHGQHIVSIPNGIPT